MGALLFPCMVLLKKEKRKKEYLFNSQGRSSTGRRSWCPEGDLSQRKEDCLNARVKNRCPHFNFGGEAHWSLQIFFSPSRNFSKETFHPSWELYFFLSTRMLWRWSWRLKWDFATNFFTFFLNSLGMGRQGLPHSLDTIWGLLSQLRVVMDLPLRLQASWSPLLNTKLLPSRRTDTQTHIWALRVASVLTLFLSFPFFFSSCSSCSTTIYPITVGWTEWGSRAPCTGTPMRPDPCSLCTTWITVLRFTPINTHTQLTPTPCHPAWAPLSMTLSREIKMPFMGRYSTASTSFLNRRPATLSPLSSSPLLPGGHMKTHRWSYRSPKLCTAWLWQWLPCWAAQINILPSRSSGREKCKELEPFGQNVVLYSFLTTRTDLKVCFRYWQLQRQEWKCVPNWLHRYSIISI